MKIFSLPKDSQIHKKRFRATILLISALFLVFSSVSCTVPVSVYRKNNTTDTTNTTNTTNIDDTADSDDAINLDENFSQNDTDVSENSYGENSGDSVEVFANSGLSDSSGYLQSENKTDAHDAEMIKGAYSGNKTDTYETEDIKEDLYSSDDTWAIYIYLCGSDLESDYGYATADLNEMFEVMDNLPDNVKLVVEIGGAEVWQNDTIEDGSVSRLTYSQNEFDWNYIEQCNMGDIKTFEDFLRFCSSNYPADHAAVVLWDHGGGSLGGAIYDEVYDMDHLALADMRAAFNSVFTLSEKNPPIELIGFDACLMATVDTAYAFRDIAHYMVASEEIEPGEGWSYSGFLQAFIDNDALNGAVLGKAICDSYAEDCNAYYVGGDITLSVVDLSRISPLIAAYHNVGVEALASAYANPYFFSRFGQGAESSEKYGSYDNRNSCTDMVDMWDLVRNSSEYLTGTSQNLEKAIADCVVYRINGPYRSQAKGLSCYYPYDMNEYKFEIFSEVTPSQAYRYLYEYLITGSLSQEGLNYAKSMKYQNIPEYDVSESPQIQQLAQPQEVPTLQTVAGDVDLENYPVLVDKNGHAVVNLGKSVDDVLTGIYFGLFYVSEDSDMVIFLGRDNDIDMSDGGIGVFRDNFRGVWGAIDGYLVYMDITYEGYSYNLYSVPILLNGVARSLRVCYDYNTQSYEILGARHSFDDSEMSDRNLIRLKPGDEITTLHYVNMSEDDDYDWELMPAETFTVTMESSFGEADLGDGVFLMRFEMDDVRNNAMYSEFVGILIEDGEIYTYYPATDEGTLYERY